MAKELDFDLPADSKLAQWLGVSEQQLQILLSLFYIEAEGGKGYPTNIMSKFQTFYDRKLRRENLFTQLVKLKEKGLLIRPDRKLYEINIGAIKDTLESSKMMVSNDLDTMSKLSSKLEKQLETISVRKVKPTVTYLREDEYLDTIGEHIPQAESVYIFSSPFPNIAYSKQLINGLQRNKFYEAVTKCTIDGRTKLHYLTSLVVELPYRRTLKFYKSERKARQETIKIIERLQYMCKTNPKLDVRFMPHPAGSNMYILESSHQGEVFISLRGAEITQSGVTTTHFRDPYPGIYIKSKDITKMAKENFMSFYNSAPSLNSKEGDNILNGLKEKVETF